MLLVVTILIILSVAYAMLRESLFTALTMFINVVLAGIITFNFWEPIADLIDPGARGTAFQDFEDWFVLTGLFCGSLSLLRTITNNLAGTDIQYQPRFGQAATVLVGLATGYVVAGFLVCLAQTLPLPQDFLGFEARHDQESPLRRWLPPDRVWLAMMRHAGAFPLARAEDAFTDSRYMNFRTFDRNGTFELRYWRYRRYQPPTYPLPYLGELDIEIERRR